MNYASVSTNSLATTLAQPIQRIQADLANAQVEASTGQFADLRIQLGAQAGHELSLRNESGLLSALTNSNYILTTNLASTQDAITSLTQSAQSIVQQLVGATASDTPQSPAEYRNFFST